MLKKQKMELNITQNNKNNYESFIIQNQIYEIIDSKIKFMEYKTQQELDVLFSSDEIVEKEENEKDKMFATLEKSSKAIKVLHMIKAKIKHCKNFIAVFDLISEDKYLHLSDFQINAI
jgi:hypothetical protein